MFGQLWSFFRNNGDRRIGKPQEHQTANKDYRITSRILRAEDEDNALSRRASACSRFTPEYRVTVWKENPSSPRTSSKISAPNLGSLPRYCYFLGIENLLASRYLESRTISTTFVWKKTKKRKGAGKLTIDAKLEDSDDDCWFEKTWQLQRINEFRTRISRIFILISSRYIGRRVVHGRAASLWTSVTQLYKQLN